MRSTNLCLTVLSVPAVLSLQFLLVALLLGTEVCRTPNIGPWRYWVGNGINRWFLSTADAEAAIRATTLAGNSDFCSVTTTSRQSDVYIGGTGTYPVYWVGIDVQHSTLVGYDITTPRQQNCQYTVQTAWGYEHTRSVTCDIGFSLKYLPPAPAYCGKPIASEEKEKMRGAAPSHCSVGNPCDLGSGNKLEVENDYQGTGPFPLSFRRSYNSVGAATYRNSTPPLWQPFGNGWSATYFQRVQLSEWGGRSTARAYRPDGRLISFELYGSQYVGDADAVERLTRTVDGSGNPTGWLLVAREDETEAYDVNGKLISVTTRSGLSHLLAYDGDGRLTTVTGAYQKFCV